MADAPTKQNITGTSVDDIKVPICVYGDTITSSQCITDDRVVIVNLYWSTPTTIGHKAALQDKNGNKIFDFYAAVANQSLMPPGKIRLPANGIYMDDLDSGSLYVYLENK